MKTCYFCKGPVKLKKIDHVHQWEGKYFLFKGIKAEVCAQCGEVFLLPQSLKAMDLKVKKPSHSKISMPVISMA